MKSTFFFLSILHLFLFTPLLSQDVQETDSLRFKAASSFVEEHKEIIIQNILATFDLDLQTDERLVPLIPKVYEIIREKIDWDSTSTQLSFLLSKKFTHDELEELTAFMRTETGQKFMSLSPELLRFYQETGIFIGMQHSDEIEQALMQYLEE